MEHTLTTSEIYTLVRRDIITFAYPPGSVISEAELTKRFSISRTPAREILKKLEHDNLVSIVPNKGTQVTTIEFKQILDFMYIREKLESGMLEELIPIVSQETIAHLSLCIAKQEQLIESDIDMPKMAKKFYELDNEFHKCIFSALNKSELWQYFSMLLPDYVRFRTMMTEVHTKENLETLLSHHKQILDCMLGEDLTTVKKIYKSHVCEGIQMFQEMILEKQNYFHI